MRSLWRNLLHRNQIDRDLDDELGAVFDTVVDEKLAAGLAPAEARRAATLQLGRVESIKTQVSDTRSGAGLETLWRDITFGLRLLRRTPSFAAATIISLALGIGATSAVFGLLNAVGIRSLPVPRAAELAEIRLEGPRCCRWTGRNRQVSLPLWREIARQQQAFSSVFAFADTRFNLAPQGEVRYVEGLFVSGEFFPVLGIEALRGRSLSPADDRPGCGNAPAVISHALWQRELGGREDVLARTLTLRSGQHPIVGVMPPRFFGVEVGRRFDVALPVCAAGFERRDHWWLAVMGRLKPGWSAAQADAHLATLGPTLLQSTIPPNYNAEQAKQFITLRFVVRPAANGISPLRTQYEEPLWLLLAIAGLVLLTACANVVSLSLVRATTREPEMAMRFALGATAFRVIRQLAVEGTLIAVAGAVLGLFVARLAADAVLAVLSTGTDPIVLDLSLDWRILSFTALVIGAVTVTFAMGPALRASRGMSSVSSERSTAGRARLAARELLVGLQVAMSVVLVSIAMLFLLTFRNLATMDLGFGTRDVLVANVFLSEERYPPATRAAAARDLTSRLAALPGVAGVAHATTPPFGGSTWGTIVRVQTAQGEVKDEVIRNQVSAGYFSVMNMPLVSGRGFTDHDTPGSSKVAIVNESFARKFFGGASPLGQRFVDGDQPFEVIGLVRDSKQYFVREDLRPITYTAASQAEGGVTVRFVIRSHIGTSAARESVSRVIADFSPSAGVRFATLSDAARDSIIRERLMAGLSVFFGLIALTLAAVGVYGVVSYTAASRQREIGIRLALGARAPHVLRTVVGRVAFAGGAGVLIGLVLTLSASAMATSFLYGVGPHEPWVFALMLVVIAAAAATAALLPARRALRTDPVLVLKGQ